MGIQRTAVAVVTVALAATALVGCVEPAPVPPPPTEEEIAAMREEQAQLWWDSMSTGTTMPDLGVIEVLPNEEAATRQTECLDEAQIPGVTVYGPGEWSYNGALGNDATGSEAQIALWKCAQQYPAEGAFEWMLSQAQTAWLYDFFSERHIPCLRTLGMEVIGFPKRDDFIEDSDGYPAWLPFPEMMRPTPPSSDWMLISKRCPLPELAGRYGIPGYTD